MPMKLESRILLAVAKRIPRGYYRILKFAAERDPALQDVPVPLKSIPFSLRADLRESVYTQLFRVGEITHQGGFDLLCRRLLRRGDVVFDIGANVGYTAALFSHIVSSPEGVVVAVEPSPRSFALLERSMASVSNVKLLNVGVSDKAGQLTFYVPPSLDRASFVPISGAVRIEVEVKSVDDLAKSLGHPCFIKVDVEGHEPNVFAGATDTLGRDDRPIVIFEALNSEVLDHCTSLLSNLSGGNYRYGRIRSDGAVVPFSDSNTSDYIAIPKWAEGRVGDTYGASDAP